MSYFCNTGSSLIWAIIIFYSQTCLLLCHSAIAIHTSNCCSAKACSSASTCLHCTLTKTCKDGCQSLTSIPKKSGQCESLKWLVNYVSHKSKFPLSSVEHFSFFQLTVFIFWLATLLFWFTHTLIFSHNRLLLPVIKL